MNQVEFFLFEIYVCDFFFFWFAEIDNEGVIEPDNDEPQAMGDENVEVIVSGSLNLCATLKQKSSVTCLCV